MLSRNGQEMDSLFFAENDDDDDGRRGVAVQQCLDSVHQYLEHRESIDIQLLAESVAADTRSADKGEATDFDVDALCADRLVIALDREIEERRASGRSRGRRIEQEQFNKFMTTNCYISTATKPLTPTLTVDDEEAKDIDIDIESEEEIECEDCFVEQLQNELLLHGVHDDTVYALSRYLRDNHFDTDSVVADSQHDDGSAIKNLIRSLSVNMNTKLDIDRVVDHFVFDYLAKTEQYSAGYRFSYWPFYKNNDDEYEVVLDNSRGKVVGHNPGYKLSEWFIECKYASFKEEILSNPKSGFSLKDWIETMTKAQMKLAAYFKNPESRPLRCWTYDLYRNRSDTRNYADRWLKLYWIKKGA